MKFVLVNIFIIAIIAVVDAVVDVVVAEYNVSELDSRGVHLTLLKG